MARKGSGGGRGEVRFEQPLLSFCPDFLYFLEIFEPYLIFYSIFTGLFFILSRQNVNYVHVSKRIELLGRVLETKVVPKINNKKSNQYQ